jgi:hypothetical protein
VLRYYEGNKVREVRSKRRKGPWLAESGGTVSKLTSGNKKIWKFE